MVSEINGPVLDYSRVLDQSDRAALMGWLFGAVVGSGLMAINIYDGFSVGRFRSALDVVLTSSAIYCTVRASQQYVTVHTVGYRNESQRHLDEAIEETAVAYQWQLTDLQSRWQHYVAHLTAQQQQQLQVLESQYSTQIEDLMGQLSDRTTDIEVMEVQLMNLKAQKFHEQEQARADAEEAREYLESDRRAIQQMRDELALSEQKLEAREQQMKQEAEQIWRDERDRLQAEQQRLEAYQAQLDAVDEQYRQEAMQMAQETVMVELECKNQVVETLKDQLNAMAEMVAQLRIPTFIEGSSRTALLANEVIRALKELNIVLLETGVWNEAGNPDIVIIQGKVSPANPDGSLANYCTVLGHVVPFLNKPENLGFIQGAIADCNTRPTVRSVSGNKLELVLDVSGVDRAAIERQQKEQERFDAAYFVPASRDKDILHMVEHNFHLGVQGESGAGKTTLLDEITHAVVDVMGDAVEIQYASTKPDPQSTTLHLITANDTQSYLEFLLDAYVNVEYRLLINRRYAAEVKHLHPNARPSKPTFKPLFYLADEINDSLNDIADLTELDLQAAWATLADRYSDNAGVMSIVAHQSERMKINTVGPKCLKKVWNLGRSEQIKFIYFGQDLMPKGLDNTGTIKRNNVYNNAMIAIGDKSIELAIEHMVKTPSERERILAEYNRMKNAIGDKVINRFQGLFVSKGNDPCVYFAPLPAPGTYVSSIIMDQLERPDEHPMSPVNKELESDTTNSVEDSSGNHIGKIECSGEHSTTPEECSIVLNPLSKEDYREHSSNSTTPITPTDGVILEDSATEHSPLGGHLDVSFYTDVIRSFRQSGSVAKVVKILFGLHTSKAMEYQVAKWKVRYVLNTRNIQFEKKTSDENRKRDRMSYEQLIEYLEGK